MSLDSGGDNFLGVTDRSLVLLDFGLVGGRLNDVDGHCLAWAVDAPLRLELPRRLPPRPAADQEVGALKVEATRQRQQMSQRPPSTAASAGLLQSR